MPVVAAVLTSIVLVFVVVMVVVAITVMMVMILPIPMTVMKMIMLAVAILHMTPIHAMVFTIALVAVSLSMIALPFLTNVVHLGPSSMPIRKILTFLWTHVLA
jgi:hypothetical protein